MGKIKNKNKNKKKTTTIFIDEASIKSTPNFIQKIQ